MGQLACVRLSKPMLESCWETVRWYVDFHVDALLLSAGKRPDNSKIRFPSFFGQSNPLKRHDVPRTRCLRAQQASASSWSSPGRSSAGAFPPGVKYPSSVAYLTSRDRRRRCLSSASGPGLEMILTSPIFQGVPPVLLGFFRLFLSFISLYCFTLVVGPLASRYRSLG